MCREESWRELERMHAAGKLRAIGVSNYTVRHLEELLAVCSVVPHVNQVSPSKVPNRDGKFMFPFKNDLLPSGFFRIRIRI